MKEENSNTKVGDGKTDKEPKTDHLLIGFL